MPSSSLRAARRLSASALLQGSIRREATARRYRNCLGEAMNKTQPIRPSALRLAKELRAKSWGWSAIADATGISQYRLRSELEPGYRKTVAERVRRNRHGTRRIVPKQEKPT